MSHLKEKIRAHLAQFDLDIRKTHNARFMDQKVTPDVLWFLAECIITYIKRDANCEFTIKNIWNSPYFIANAQFIFGKPSPRNITAKHEYDKFVSQPIKILHYSGILKGRSAGRSILYSVSNQELLNFIAVESRTAFGFLYEYITKVLIDSGFYNYIEEFEELYRKGRLRHPNFQDLKYRFQRFIIGNTPINGEVEVNRIFPKVLNIISARKMLPGTIKGHMSNHIIFYPDLMYNRPNWRDINKDKYMTRQEAAKQQSPLSSYDYRIYKAKEFIRNKYKRSELTDQWGKGPADHVHHIFPSKQFAILAEYFENLIKLTATQHLSKAHPRGATRLVDPVYQKQCLLAKSMSIEKSLDQGEPYYRKEFFIHIINIGYNVNLSYSMSLKKVRDHIQSLY